MEAAWELCEALRANSLRAASVSLSSDVPGASALHDRHCGALTRLGLTRLHLSRAEIAQRVYVQEEEMSCESRPYSLCGHSLGAKPRLRVENLAETLVVSLVRILVGVGWAARVLEGRVSGTA